MQRSLAPGFLVATPPLNDPNFVRALILMVTHGSEGALGLVINGERTVASVSDLLDQLGLVSLGRNESPVRLGGPVQPEIGWIVYRPDADHVREGELRLTPHIAVTQSRDVLASIGRNDGPKEYATYLGYTGWAPGQLEDEIRQGAWIPLDLDPSMVFDVPVADRWHAAYDSYGLNPAALMATMKGGSA